MAEVAFSKPLEDSVPKVDGEVAVGEDLEFQRKWWRFERVAWSIFAVLLVLDLLGLFGRGYLARAERRNSDQTMDVRYDRIQRTGTPSMLSIDFGPQAIHDGKVELFVSESLIRQLGAQRIIPSPISTSVGDGGFTYTFPATRPPAMVEFALQPDGPGAFPFRLKLAGSPPVDAKVVVVP